MFIMLSAAWSASGSKLEPAPYQHFWIDALLGESPGCPFDKDSSFDGQLWYAFVEVLEGEIGHLQSVDLDPANWYPPCEVIHLDQEVVVPWTYEKSHPSWWLKMLQFRGKPTYTNYLDYMVFPVFGGTEPTALGWYSLSPEQLQAISNLANAELSQADLVHVEDSEVVCDQ